MDTSVIAPIRNERDHRKTERTVRALWGASPGTPEADRLEVRMVLLERYEAEHHRIEPPDSIDAIQIRMQELGIDRAGFARILSTTSGRVSEILNRRRRLTIDMIRRLAEALGLSERCLLQPYELAPRGAEPSDETSGPRWRHRTGDKDVDGLGRARPAAERHGIAGNGKFVDCFSVRRCRRRRAPDAVGFEGLADARFL